MVPEPALWKEVKLSIQLKVPEPVEGNEKSKPPFSFPLSPRSFSSGDNGKPAKYFGFYYSLRQAQG
ncbi:MAG: hypothetical protein M3R25_06385, partial [Bacteroidota bacterium]|nr:hypothetical protein [Bacteroidota bacterium]